MVNFDIAYFGYGSLVNRQTRPAHTYAIPARVSGWIRQWRHRAEFSTGKMCALSVDRRPGVEIAGVLVFDNRALIKQTDEREVGYYREPIDVEHDLLEGSLQGIETDIYLSTPAYNCWADTESPIWRSYLDCVLAGFLDTFGREGAVKFMSSTEGWSAPILDDRHAPKYPRHVKPSPQVQRQIDEVLEEHLPSSALVH